VFREFFGRLAPGLGRRMMVRSFLAVAAAGGEIFQGPGDEADQFREQRNEFPGDPAAAGPRLDGGREAPLEGSEGFGRGAGRGGHADLLAGMTHLGK
jgi:hypothetical protein